MLDGHLYEIEPGQVNAVLGAAWAPGGPNNRTHKTCSFHIRVTTQHRVILCLRPKLFLLLLVFGSREVGLFCKPRTRVVPMGKP
jgi:hypothetical protein